MLLPPLKKIYSRRLAAWRNRHYRFFHHPGYSLGHLADLFGLRKAPLVKGEFTVAALLENGVLTEAQLQRPQPISVRDLQLFHSAQYLEDAFQGNNFVDVFGQTLPPQFDSSTIVHSQRLMVGATTSAFRSLIEEDLVAAINFGGGLHHAERGRGSGFCLFNDIGVAIEKAKILGLSKKITVIDLDYHQGNGVIEGFAHDDQISQYSISGILWRHEGEVLPERFTEYVLPSRTDDKTYLKQLRETLPQFLKGHAPAFCLYVAGTDILRGDPYGDFGLSAEGVISRDWFVFNLLRSLNIPFVFVTAGGYSEQSWKITYRSLSNLLRNTHQKELPHKKPSDFTFTQQAESKPDKKKTDKFDLNLDEQDLFELGSAFSTKKKFLGRYSIHFLEHVLEKFGVYRKLREQSLTDLELELDLYHSDGQRMVLKGASKSDPEHKKLLGEIVVSSQMLRGLCLLRIEWFFMQNPFRELSENEIAFPEQNYPGLGISQNIQTLLCYLAKSLHWDGLLNVPSYFHVAMISSRSFQFLDPKIQARHLLLKTLLGPYPLPLATRILIEKRVSNMDGEILNWIPSSQILPLSQEAKSIFRSEAYNKIKQEEFGRLYNQRWKVDVPIVAKKT